MKAKYCTVWWNTRKWKKSSSSRL